MAANTPTQRRFAVMGENLFKVVNKIMDNQKICRLLKYQDSNPFKDFGKTEGTDHPDVDGLSLLNNQIIIVPKIPEMQDVECSFIIVVFDKYVINPANPDFKLSTIRFDIVCPFSEWVIDGENLRPYILMQEIDSIFNQAKMSGLGNLQFTHCEPLVLSPHLGGYTMYYQINEFN